jgi:hypothetical protein
MYVISANKPGLTVSSTIQTFPIASGTSAFFDYVVSDTTAVAYRSGIVMCVWDGTNVSYTDTSTADLGNTTSGIEFQVTLVTVFGDSSVRFYANITSGTWNVKVATRIL